MKKAVFKIFLQHSQESGKSLLKLTYFTKRRLQHSYFRLNIAKFFIKAFFEEHLVTAASGFLKQLHDSEQLLH